MTSVMGDPLYVALFGLIALVAMMIFGLPVFIVFLLINLIGAVAFFGLPAVGLFTNSLLATLTTETFVTIPLYFFLGEILFRSRAIDDLSDGLDGLIPKMRVKMYMLGIGTAAALGAVSGSAMADAALLGRTLYPSLVERGHDKHLSAGLIMAGATLAPIIPPSVMVVIIATLAQQSVSDLLIAGILPGIMLAGLIALYVIVRVHFDPTKAPDPGPIDERPARGLLESVGLILPIVVIFGVVVGLIVLGIATPTESAAFGSLFAVTFGFAKRRLSLRTLYDAALAAAATSAMILLIIMCASLFGQLISFTGLPNDIIGLVTGLSISPLMIHIFLLLVAFVLCQFLGQAEFILISVPIFGPLIPSTQTDPVAFWTSYLVIITVAAMTPPFGITLFVFKGAAPGISLGEIYRASWPFVLTVLFGVGVMLAVPELSTFLPSLTR